MCYVWCRLGSNPAPLDCMLLASKRLFSLILSPGTQILSRGTEFVSPWLGCGDTICRRGQNRGTEPGDRTARDRNERQN